MNNRALTVAVIALGLTGNLSFAAEKLTKESIIEALQASGPRDLDVDELRKTTLRQIAKGKESLESSASASADDAIAADEGVQLEIFFDYNSAEILERSKDDLRVLGDALRDDQLAGTNFLIAGHTDAAGEQDYNYRLSDARAQAVRRFLLAEYPISPRRLETIGFGEERLKDAAAPEAAINRRVQIINLGQR